MNEAMTQGVELMLTGMGIVFLFLVMLIAVVKLMAYLVTTFIPEVEVATTPVNVTTSQAVNSNVVTPTVAAAISAAIYQHRAKHKK